MCVCVSSLRTWRVLPPPYAGIRASRHPCIQAHDLKAGLRRIELDSSGFVRVEVDYIWANRFLPETTPNYNRPIIDPEVHISGVY